MVPQSGTKGEKVLGLARNLQNETIRFNFEHIARKKESSELTKRSLLSLLSSSFDLLGLISGIIVSMKILFQDVCKSKLGWDDIFGNDMKKRLDKWIKDLVATREIYVDRCLYDANVGNISECYLHGFGDASKLKGNQLWWNGPTWLSEQPSNWPSYFEISKTLESFLEEKKSATILSVKKDQVSSLKAVIDIERYSSLMRLLKVTAWIRRAVNNFRKLLNKNECVTTNLTVEEINRAEIEWVKVTQCELKEQDNYKQLARKLGLVEDRILRCTGRLGNSDLELDAQKPSISLLVQ